MHVVRLAMLARMERADVYSIRTGTKSLCLCSLYAQEGANSFLPCRSISLNPLRICTRCSRSPTTAYIPHYAY